MATEPSTTATPAPAPAPAFVSLGMVVLDEIRFPDGRILRDVPGGSGFYGTLGARLAVPQDEAGSVCCLITAGSDFPASVRRQIEGWGTRVHLEEVPGKPSTRGLLEYEDDVFGKKTFRYTTPPLHPDVARFPKDLLRASVIHALATPEDLGRHAETLANLRSSGGAGGAGEPRPLIAWEPSPINIRDREQAHMSAVGLCDICSPNDHELLRMMGATERGPGVPYDRRAVENYTRRLAGDPGSPPEPAGRRRVTVIRCGEEGCLVIPRRGSGPVWLPPFHGAGSARVVDATGAGNAFLGAFAVALARTDDEVLAAAYGAVAAGFVVEQVGPPARELVGGRELWNGEAFGDRLRQYGAVAGALTTPGTRRGDPGWPS